MANNDQNLYHLNQRFHQHNNSALINMFKPLNHREDIRPKNEKKIEVKIKKIKKTIKKLFFSLTRFVLNLLIVFFVFFCLGKNGIT